MYSHDCFKAVNFKAYEGNTQWSISRDWTNCLTILSSGIVRGVSYYRSSTFCSHSAFVFWYNSPNISNRYDFLMDSRNKFTVMDEII